MSAGLFGAGLGLALGAVYLQAGLADHNAERARAAEIAESAYGYTGSWLEGRGPGLRTGLERFGFGVRAEVLAARGSTKVRRRAELECLADAVYYEARGESARGQAAVAQVVLNRVKHPAYPKSVCGVVFQGAGRSGCQFSFACDGSMRRRRETEAWADARHIAGRVLAGAMVSHVGKATHFHTTSVSPFWAPHMLRVATVGTHIFYKPSPYRRAPTPTLSEPALILTAGAAPETTELQVSPAVVEKSIEASLAPATAEAAAKPAAATVPKPSEAAKLETAPGAIPVAAS